MARAEQRDIRNDWRLMSTPHFAPLEGQIIKQQQTPAHMPTLGAFMLARMVGKIKTLLLPWVCVFRSHDYPPTLEPTHCRRCGRSSLHDAGD